MNSKNATGIVTRTGKLNGKMFINYFGMFFYMYKDGRRAVSVGEKKKGVLPNSQEWNWALKNWENPEVTELNAIEQMHADNMAAGLKTDFFFGMSDQDMDECVNNHAAKVGNLAKKYSK